MLENALETLSHIVRVDGLTMSIVGLLAAWAGTLVRSMTDSTALGVCMAPAVYFGALTSIFFCREYGIVFMYQKDANIVASASTGMVLSLVIVLLAMRLVYATSARSKTGLEDRITDEG